MLVNQPYLGSERREAGGDGVGHPGGDREPWRPEPRQKVVGRHPSDPMRIEHGGEATTRQPGPCRGIGMIGQDRPQPRTSPQNTGR